MPPKKISLYSAEKYDKTGNGNISIHLKANQNNEEYIKMLRDEQKMKNKFYKENKKNGNQARDLNYYNSKAKEVKDLKHSKNIDLKLDPKTGNTTCILGSSKRGKSTLLMYLFKKYYNKKSFINLLFSVNAHIKLYKNPNLIKFCEFEEQIIKDQLAIQRGTNNEYKFCNIFDDMITLKKETINNLVLTYRNSNISTIISMQYGFLLSKMIRANANNFILFGFNSDEAIEDIIKLFLRSWFKREFKVSSMEDMINIYKNITNNHGFIYIHPQTDSISIHRLQI